MGLRPQLAATHGGELIEAGHRFYVTAHEWQSAGVVRHVHLRKETALSDARGSQRCALLAEDRTSGLMVDGALSTGRQNGAVARPVRVPDVGAAPIGATDLSLVLS